MGTLRLSAVLEIQRIRAAAERARKHVQRTPLVPVEGALLKLECLQSAGSFKVRGQKLKFEGSLSQTADKATPLRWPVKLTVKGDLLDASLDGHLDVAEDLALSGQTEITTPSVRRAARWFGVPLA